MNIAKSVNIARLVTAYNLQIDSAMLPDNLKCVKCKLVLTDACQVPCGCRFCRACIDEMMASGSEASFVRDCRRIVENHFYRALLLTTDHMRVCQKESETCPFYKWGCQQKKMAVKEMSGHFQEENRSHCEILIGMIVDITREVDMLKRCDESSKMEIEMLKRSDESNKIEIEMLKISDESTKIEIGELKRQLVLKDGQITMAIDQIGHLENEIKSIKQEKADLANLVLILSGKVDREIDERHESDERDMANVIEHIDREVNVITAVVGSNKDELDTGLRSVRDDIRSINQDSIKFIARDIQSLRIQLQSIQALVKAGQIDASCEWTIDADVGKTTWDWSLRDTNSINTGISQDYFIGAVLPYKYRLASANVIGTFGNALRIYLRIYPGPCDSQLPWPFSGRVTISVADKGRHGPCNSITQEYEIRKPVNNYYSNSAVFAFSHSSLITAGLKIDHGVRVSCAIVPLSLCR